MGSVSTDHIHLEHHVMMILIDGILTVLMSIDGIDEWKIPG